MTPRTKRAAAGGLAAITGAVGISAFSPAPVSANADGCTFGPSMSTVCVVVDGWKTYVGRTDASVATYANPSNLCRTQSLWTARRNGGGIAKLSPYRRDCVWIRAYFTWRPQMHFDHNSQFCGSTRSDVSGDQFPSPACVKIKQ